MRAGWGKWLHVVLLAGEVLSQCNCLQQLRSSKMFEQVSNYSSISVFTLQRTWVIVNSGVHIKTAKPNRDQVFQFENTKQSDQIRWKSTTGITAGPYTVIQISISTSDRRWKSMGASLQLHIHQPDYLQPLKEPPSWSQALISALAQHAALCSRRRLCAHLMTRMGKLLKL